jgi:allophanate hydrolase subunit 2
MAYMTQIQPGRQFRFIKIKRREVAALRRARDKWRSQVRDGKEKSG